ncbi:hypothetical protein PG985_006563 [Apiospora marii]|uniref:uncharacterized protein n=1 Tax=Apiospora marii TaxID=335849 RepID=UPI003131E742
MAQPETPAIMAGRVTRPAALGFFSVVIAVSFPAVSLAATAWRAVRVGAPEMLVAKVRGGCTVVAAAVVWLLVDSWGELDELPPSSAVPGFLSPFRVPSAPLLSLPAGGWGRLGLPPSLAPGLLPPLRVPSGLLSGLSLFAPPAPPVVSGPLAVPDPGGGWREVGLAPDAFVLGEGREALPVDCGLATALEPRTGDCTVAVAVALRAGASTGLASRVGRAPVELLERPAGVEEAATDWDRDAEANIDA